MKVHKPAISLNLHSGFSATRINLSPFTKDFRAEEHNDESIAIFLRSDLEVWPRIHQWKERNTHNIQDSIIPITHTHHAPTTHLHKICKTFCNAVAADNRGTEIITTTIMMMIVMIMMTTTKMKLMMRMIEMMMMIMTMMIMLMMSWWWRRSVDDNADAWLWWIRWWG